MNDKIDNNSALDTADTNTAQLSLPVLKNVIEAAILAANKAISIDKIYSLFSEAEVCDKNQIRQSIEELMQDYQSRGIELIEVSSGFRFQVTQTAAPWVSRLWEEKPQKYSRALLETLALVAYRQPVTRGDIEEIRGVSVSSQIMRTLVEREWVRIIGHKDVPGKPALYATTRSFLDYFGLKKLDELPSLSAIRDLDIINAELDFGAADSSENKEKTEEPSMPEPEEIPKLEAIAEPEAMASETVASESTESLETRSLNQEAAEQGSPLENTAGVAATTITENPDSERINIDEALNALKETYQKIDAIDKKTDTDQN